MVVQLLEYSGCNKWFFTSLSQIGLLRKVIENFSTSYMIEVIIPVLRQVSIKFIYTKYKL